MEAPEKIYLPEEPFKYGDSEKCWNYKPLGGIEYTRTDVIVEKVWNWIEDNVLSPNQQDKSLLYYEQFKNYMKGE